MKKIFLIVLLLCLSFPIITIASDGGAAYRVDVLLSPADVKQCSIDGDYIYAQNADDKLVVYNRRMEVVVPPIYDYTTERFSNGRLVVSHTETADDVKKTHYGVINLSGELIVDYQYKKIGRYENGKALAQTDEGEVLFIDAKGGIIRSFGIYGYFEGFAKGIAFVRKEPVQNENVLKLSSRENGIQLYSQSDLGGVDYTKAEAFANQPLSGFCFIDEYGSVIAEDIDANKIVEKSRRSVDLGSVMGTEETISVTMSSPKFSPEGIAIIKRNGMTGIIDAAGNILCDFSINKADIINGRIYADTSTATLVFDLFGNKLYENSYHYLFLGVHDIQSPVVSDDKRYFVVSENGNYGVVSDENDVMIPIQYRFLWAYSGKFDLFFVDSLVGYNISLSYSDHSFRQLSSVVAININGSEMLTNRYIGIEPIGKSGDFWSGFDRTGSGTQCYIINKAGELLFPEAYSYICGIKVGPGDGSFSQMSTSYWDDDRFFNKYGLVYAKPITGKLKLIDLRKGKVIGEYDSIEPLEGIHGYDYSAMKEDDYDRIIVSNNGKYGIINPQGEVIVHTVYDEIHQISTDNYDVRFDVASAKKGKKYAVIDTKGGKELTGFLYDSFEPIYEKPYLYALADGKWGVVDFDGMYNIPCKYESKYVADKALMKLQQTDADTNSPPIPMYRRENLDKSSVVSYWGKNGEETRFYDNNEEMILYYKTENGERYMYDADDNYLFTGNFYNIGDSLSSAKENSNVFYITRTTGGNKGGLVAINKIPKPQGENSKSKITLMLNNPFVNIRGDLKLLDDKNYFFTPILENDHILVPLRVISEALESEVVWESNTETVTVNSVGRELTLKIGKQEMYVNGDVIWLDVAPKIVDDRILVPIRAVSEGLGVDVRWDDANKTVEITTTE